MYSPKIREHHIPRLYRIAKSRNKPMTQIVDEIIGKALAMIDNKDTDTKRGYNNGIRKKLLRIKD